MIKKPSKKAVIVTSAVALACAIGCGVWYYLGHNSSDPVYVYPFQYIGMTEYWGDSQESYGPVSTDKIQTIFLSDTQTVTEICVTEGQEVKKGDLLMTFDTTLSDLALERKRLDVEKLKLQMKEAQKQLREINSMKPMEVPDFTPPDPADPDLGESLTGEYKIYGDEQNNGSSQATPLIAWVNQNESIDSNFISKLFAEILGKAHDVMPEETEPPATPEPSEEPEESTDGSKDESTDGSTDESTDGSTDESTDGSTDDSTDESTDGSTDESTEESTDDSTGESTDDSTEESVSDDSPEDIEIPDEPITPDPTETEEPVVPESSEEELEHSSASGVEFFEGGKQPEKAESCYAIIKVTEGNMSRGPVVTWQGIHLINNGTSFKFFNAAGIPDHSLTDDGDSGIIDMPDMDFGSGMTAAQIAQMRADQQKKIKDLDFQISMADAEYRIMQTELSDGNIYSDIDGKVIALIPEEEARDQGLPLMKVSGGGGFFIDGTVNELDKDTLKIGQEVTINDWRGGGTYTGTIQEIGDFPSMEESWNGMGNPNASFYPFRVFVDESADLQAGNYVSVMYAAGTSENGIYLQNPFLRTEKGRSYVLVQGENGRLEQRFVTVGKALWGSYTEILSGLSAEDKVAFPYGKNVKPGVAAQEGDMSNLYG